MLVPADARHPKRRQKKNQGCSSAFLTNEQELPLVGNKEVVDGRLIDLATGRISERSSRASENRSRSENSSRLLDCGQSGTYQTPLRHAYDWQLVLKDLRTLMTTPSQLTHELDDI